MVLRQVTQPPFIAGPLCLILHIQTLRQFFNLPFIKVSDL